MKKKIVSLLTAIVMTLGVVGCGGTTSTETAENEAVAESSETAETTSVDGIDSNETTSTEFPITIQHGLGETVIESKPENVVAIAWGNPDVPLALGIVPVGISEANFGPRDENGLLAWTAQAFEELGVEPNVFDDTDGWDYEAIADSNPDVILAAYSGLSQEEYDRLSEIAPVVAYPEIAWSTTWQEETINDATALGLE
ncbi:MAG: ABC transporter substrate-binding protein, partial [Pseudobutyrivibrio sp.]|nr:ABC transporter substrate-binding protein [Pseudobutyrivibrio sp.]